MRSLYLLRHGPTQASAQGAPLGRADLPVSPAGEACWPLVKAALQELGLRRVLSSDLLRARAHAQDLGLPGAVLADLAEQGFGAWDARPWKEIQGSEGFFTDPVHAVPPGGESFAQCAGRSVAALAGALEGDFPLLVLAHGGPLRAILGQYLGLPLERRLDLAWQPFGLSRLDLYADGRGVLAFHNRALAGGTP